MKINFRGLLTVEVNRYILLKKDKYAKSMFELKYFLLKLIAHPPDFPGIEFGMNGEHKFQALKDFCLALEHFIFCYSIAAPPQQLVQFGSIQTVKFCCEMEDGDRHFEAQVR